MKTMLVKKVHGILAASGFLIFLLSCTHSTKDGVSAQPSCFSYNREYQVLYLRNCDKPEIPDSIAAQQVHALHIYTSGSVDFDYLSGQIDLKKIGAIWIDSLDQEEINLDLAKLPGLKAFSVWGRSGHVKKINILNIGDSLKHLVLQAPNIIFPAFDSAFLRLESFKYQGASEVIPSWVENLDKVTVFSFAVTDLKEIRCNVCNMDSVKEFWIAPPCEEDSCLRNMIVYPTIKKFKACKPALKLWPGPPLNYI
jgi:hypothetical protein